jgi:hypothetical protein
MRRRLRDDRGTAVVMFVLLFTALVAFGALAYDFGSWYRAQRNLQSAADAAALAAAQDLPNTATASTTATNYATNNVSGSTALKSWTPTFPTTSTIDIRLERHVPGTFAKLVGVTGLDVGAHSRAQVGSPGSMKNLAAIVVNQNLACRTDAANCFGPDHTKELDFDGTPGAGAGAGLVDLKGHNISSTACTANTNTTEMQNWIINGFGGFLPVNHWYASPPGVKNGVQTALNQVIGRVLLYPVFDTGSQTACAGAGGFHIIGWAAFVITSITSWNNGSGHKLNGYFVQYIAHDVELTPGVPGFGVKVIKLTQ